MKAKVLVTGSKGQLGQSIQSYSEDLFKDIEFTFVDIDTLDITNKKSIKKFFKKHTFSHVINCAAYTAVDKAEEEQKLSRKVNFKGVKRLAKACLKYNITLIHISTDFVFDGNSDRPYNEEDQTNPLSVYGVSKLKGEEAITKILDKYFIVRTSWLYSEFGNNFVKTMLRLAETKKEISVVNDQIGTPTYAKDLAFFLLKLIRDRKEDYGIYHYSNIGEISWYDFAKSIFKLSNNKIKVNPIPSSEFPTLATRPTYSTLSKQKIITTFNYKIHNWKDSLERCLKVINK